MTQEKPGDHQKHYHDEAPSPKFVVGVGASAGGLQALGEFFQHLPKLDEVAYVVVQHLSPDYESLMAELLSKQTALSVRKAVNGVAVRGGEVWVIPPRKNITIVQGRLVLTDLPGTRTFNLPIDVFLRSLARAYEDRAIAVILSGTGSDGTLGIREIKGAGGLALVQSPKSARFDGMPKSALATRIIDYEGSPEELATRIVEFARSVDPSQVSAAFETEAPDAVASILDELKAHSGIDFTAYRSGTLMRRISKRMQMAKLSDLGRYAAYLHTSSAEVAALHKDVLIGVTSFFRDAAAYEALRTTVIPQLCTSLPARATVRAWSVGCSTGEEPYSVGALLLAELNRRERSDLDVKVFATDVDTDALRIAAAGIYPISALLDVPNEIVSHYFVKEGDSYRVSEKLRRVVIFSRHNICRDPPFNRIDLISCRNLLIYLKPPVQRQILEVFRYALKPEGCLFLGHSETLGDDAINYRVINHRWKLYRRNAEAPRPSLNHLHVPQQDEVRYFERGATSKRGATGRRELRVFRQVMARYAPPSVVFDRDLRVVLAFGPINDFLEVPVGELDFDLLRLAAPELSPVLSTVTHRLFKDGERVIYRGVSVADKDDVVRTIDVMAEPFALRDHQNLYIVVFEERVRGVTGMEQPEHSAMRYDTAQHIDDLKTELQYTKETLQATIEELETANEELQATNEELLASNEELQSTNEELQSVNEELVTVNTEFQEKILELSEVNNDIENLLNNTRLGVIFLDRKMRVRRYTPAVRPIVKLIPGDVGRALSDLSFHTKPIPYVELANQVLETLIPEERDIETDAGAEYRMTIVPYRTREDVIQGVVLLFMDVTERRTLAEQLEEAHAEITSLRELGGESSAPLRVLLVEDNPDDVELISATFRRSKFHCELEAVDTLARAREQLFDRARPLPDLILLDIELPDGDGIELLKEIKASPATLRLPVVVISARAEDANVRRAYEQHAACFVNKALDASSLEKIVRSVGGFWLTIVRLSPGAD